MPILPIIADSSDELTEIFKDLHARPEIGFTESRTASVVAEKLREYNPNSRRMAELIAVDLSAIGVEIEIVTFEWGEYLKRAKDAGRDGAVLLGFIADTVDPDNFVSTMFSCKNVGGSNLSNWCNREVEDLMGKAAVSSDHGVRGQLY